ncbi:hypothetical protein ACMGDK_11290 [Chryseobacterium sp. DT-3]|uniref:hypothetical protein n=1 Tax=Chryseobacterium sp. DT-3 TaxID=3396164 RepID=UPI003F1AC9CE
MDSNNIFEILENLAMDAPEDINDFYETSMGVIHSEAVERKIEFDGYFRTKWEIESNNVMTFDKEYFEDLQRKELYVFLAALIDEDIFEYLEYVWSLYKGEDLTENILHREIYLLKEKGVRF